MDCNNTTARCIGVALCARGQVRIPRILESVYFGGRTASRMPLKFLGIGDSHSPH